MCGELCLLLIRFFDTNCCRSRSSVMTVLVEREDESFKAVVMIGA